MNVEKQKLIKKTDGQNIEQMRKWQMVIKVARLTTKSCCKETIQFEDMIQLSPAIHRTEQDVFWQERSSMVNCTLRSEQTDANDDEDDGICTCVDIAVHVFLLECVCCLYLAYCALQLIVTSTVFNAKH